MGELLHVSSSPHIRSKVTTDYLMKMVIVALMPATVAGVCFFGWKALLLVCLSVATCVATEGIYETLMHKPLTIWDGSAVITGLLLGLNLPASAPWWIPVIGGVFAILIVKQLFGGLGQNIMNPALAARCFLLLSFTGQMTNFSADGGLVKLVDTVSGATPLAAVKAGEKVDLLSLFLGNTQGTIGETSALASILHNYLQLFYISLLPASSIIYFLHNCVSISFLIITGLQLSLSDFVTPCNFAYLI